MLRRAIPTLVVGLPCASVCFTFCSSPHPVFGLLPECIHLFCVNLPFYIISVSLFFAKSYHGINYFISKPFPEFASLYCISLYFLVSLSSVAFNWLACIIVFWPLLWTLIKILGFVPMHVSLHIFQVYYLNFKSHSDYAGFRHLFGAQASLHVLTLFHCIYIPM